MESFTIIAFHSMRTKQKLPSVSSLTFENFKEREFMYIEIPEV
jgi:hypothetical protein